MTTTARFLAVSCAFALGCGGQIEDEGLLSESSSNVVATNGLKFNGLKFNGLKFNGTLLSGAFLSGATLNGGTLQSVTLNGTSFSGKKSDGTTVSGLGFKGTRINGTASDGRAVTLVLANIVTTADPDILEYAVKWVDSDGSLKETCVKADGSPAPAIPLRHWWLANGSQDTDPTHFTFACKDLGAIAKCVYMGYKPWKTKNNVSLAPYHQACVRMLRGDYCGDGRSYTRDGEIIDLFDKLSINVDDTWRYPSCGFKFEAEWDANGARCISGWRYTSSTKPACADAKYRSTCGNPIGWSSGTLLADKSVNLRTDFQTSSGTISQSNSLANSGYCL